MILVVDDNPLMLKALRSILEAYGDTVMEAADVQQALELADANEPEMVITDLVLAENGFTLAKKLRAAYPEMPILALSGWDGGDLRALGFTETLQKPIKMPDLLAAVRRNRRSTE